MAKTYNFAGWVAFLWGVLNIIFGILILAEIIPIPEKDDAYYVNLWLAELIEYFLMVYLMLNLKSFLKNRLQYRGLNIYINFLLLVGFVLVNSVVILQIMLYRENIEAENLFNVFPDLNPNQKVLIIVASISLVVYFLLFLVFSLKITLKNWGEVKYLRLFGIISLLSILIIIDYKGFYLNELIGSLGDIFLGLVFWNKVKS